ncbi:protein OXIDATIVE STRESS 3 LIKE 2-like [Impatiens glandulifera]|uniref:protein OXIDATIVE STRESS 3 LIKE 2-like n=1 Tax=Impatiens glandulifera TaxID=253017 RepID=UPI001FB19218|nr:protein OXIDATIVE STRESS 3 LIKE 2-like [Impatiens glandulifera]
MSNSSPPDFKKQSGGAGDYDSDFSISGVESSSSSSSSSDDDNKSETISSPTTDHQPPVEGPLKNMSSLLLRQLPIKRGLSMHYDGKSQSFTSLSNVKCLEDLPKPENPYKKKKKFKSCGSYGGGLLMISSNKTISPPPTFF